MRTLLLIHRFMGIACGWTVVVWCLSGAVLVYVPYPRLTEVERRAGLASIAHAGGCVFPEDLFRDEESWRDFRIEMLGDRLVLRAGAKRPIDLASGEPLLRISADLAATTADRFFRQSTHIPSLARSRLVEVVYDDPWTVSGIRDGERPLYRFAADDPAGSELYVSTVSGRVVQATQRRQRLWTWLGAIPHWLYYASLRRHVRVWSQVVIGVSLAGCVLAVSGIVVGVKAARRLAGGWTARRGLSVFHHVAGLAFGTFTLGWAVSGLLSMNPWGLLEGGGAEVEASRLRGLPPPAGRLQAAVARLASALPGTGAVSVVAAPLGGATYFVVESAGGTRSRVDEDGRAAPLAWDDVTRAARDLGAGQSVETVDLLPAGDEYVSGTAGAAVASLYRVILSDPGRTRYYLDSVSARLEAKFDPAARYYRWLFLGVHRGDLWPVLRREPLRKAVVLGLLAGVLAGAATGVVLGGRRRSPF